MNNQLQNRTLFFGDNLEILAERIPDNTFDLIYLDPPFNSNRNYNVLFKEGQIDSSAQIHAFEDTWEWTTPTVKLFEELKTSSYPQIAILTASLSEFIGQNAMMAYLVNMITRLIPLRRVLKPTGAIYLHCDPTASHYLKMAMDTIFGIENFRNEIIWRRGHSVKNNTGKQFPRSHDVIFYYSKDHNKLETFNKIFRDYEAGTLRNYTYDDKDGRGVYRLQSLRTYGQDTIKKMEDENRIYVTSSGKKWMKQYLKEKAGKQVDTVWDDIPSMEILRSEQLGYPTQKPELLLERIIEASSNENNWILDPFCGCGTTVAVAERLNRNWVGIDISMQAVNVINQRMKAHYPNIKVGIDGIPMDFQSAENLSERDKFAFQDWAITLVGANPPSGESKKGADRGVDGIILFYDHLDLTNPKLKKIIVQVKGGHTNRGDIAKLKGDIDRENAPMGIFITLNEPTSEMKREAVLSGEYQYSESTSFPKIQILSVKDWFEGKNVLLPSDKVNPFKEASAKINHNQVSLF